MKRKKRKLRWSTKVARFLEKIEALGFKIGFIVAALLIATINMIVVG